MIFFITRKNKHHSLKLELKTIINKNKIYPFEVLNARAKKKKKEKKKENAANRSRTFAKMKDVERGK